MKYIVSTAIFILSLALVSCKTIPNKQDLPTIARPIPLMIIEPRLNKIESMRKDDIFTIVKLNFIISPEGKVLDVVPHNTDLTYSAKTAFVKAVGMWRYKPIVQQGIPKYFRSSAEIIIKSRSNSDSVKYLKYTSACKADNRLCIVL